MTTFPGKINMEEARKKTPLSGTNLSTVVLGKLRYFLFLFSDVIYHRECQQLAVQNVRGIAAIFAKNGYSLQQAYREHRPSV